MLNEVRRVFRERFRTQPAVFVSPGRINLIGEHTDYHDGFVLPAAVDKTIVLAVGLNTDNVVRLHALNIDASVDVSLDRPLQPAPEQWANYPLGVVAQLQAAGYAVPGFDLVFGGDLPIGAGMSSSAAVECGLAFALNDLLDLGLDVPAMARLAQRAEHEYAGMQCGIMDQFAVLAGRDEHAIRLDCRSLEYEYVPLTLGDCEIVLCDTLVKHSLANSQYNRRRRECAGALEIIARRYPAESLRDVGETQLHECRALLSETAYRRCEYVLAENDRVERACRALNGGDLHTLGRLMFQSHRGLKEQYEVSCPELDTLVDIAADCPGVLGARMMGGGFGGCTINLVHKTGRESFVETVVAGYEREYARQPTIVTARTGPGTHRLG